MRIGRYEFRPRLLASLMALAGCGLFMGLTLWQAQRAVDKRELQFEWERLRQLPPLDTPAQLDHAQPNRRVQLPGRLLLQHEVLLDNRVHKGRAGYDVITPVELDGDDRILLVNRGWVGLGPTRAQPPATPGPSTRVIVNGMLYRPAGRPLGLSEQTAREVSTQRVLPFLNRQLIASRLTRPVFELAVRLDAEAPYGFVREWPRIDTKVGMHLAYALQWLAFALIALATYLYVSIHRIGPSK